MAWHYKQYAYEQSIEDRQKYSLAEEIAKDSHVGLWADPQPVPPWVWRKNNR
jgi:endonuclease YncB( thermonuclease family)